MDICIREPLFLIFYFCVINFYFCIIYFFLLTHSGGCLGSHNDEERSKLRNVMWIAELVNHRIFERKWRSQDSLRAYLFECPSSLNDYTLNFVRSVLLCWYTERTAVGCIFFPLRVLRDELWSPEIVIMFVWINLSAFKMGGKWRGGHFVSSGVIESYSGVYSRFAGRSIHLVLFREGPMNK